MKESQKQQKKSSELPSLTPYHWKRSKEAQKAVEEMMKHPLSAQEMREQIQSNKRMLEEQNRKKR